MKVLRALAIALGAVLCATPASADFLFTAGSGNTAVAFDASHSGTSRCAAALTQCFANVIINSAGTEVGTTSNPFQVTGATGTFPASQSGTWTVTQSGTWTFNPTTAASWALGATGTAVPANAHYLGMSQGGNLTGLTGTSGNLNVQCANCSGSGVSTADQAAFTAGSSLFAGSGGFFQTTATNNPLTNGQQGMLQMTANRAAFTNLRDSTGAELNDTTNHVVLIDTKASGNLLSAINGGSAATGTAPPSAAIYFGANGSGATGGQLRGVITCDNHVFKHITSATDTLAVQGVASQSIYVCAWRSRAAGTATWFLENTASTNANCASTNTQITGLASEVVNSGETWGSAFWSGLKNTSGNGLCINSTGTGGVDLDLWYAQF